MITEFSKYNNEPKAGDWIWATAKDERKKNREFASKLENSVGQVVEAPEHIDIIRQEIPNFDWNYGGVKDYFKGWKVKYDWNEKPFIVFKREIDFFDKDKKVVEAYIEANKYNL